MMLLVSQNRPWKSVAHRSGGCVVVDGKALGDVAAGAKAARRRSIMCLEADLRRRRNAFDALINKLRMRDGLRDASA